MGISVKNIVVRDDWEERR